MTSFAALSLGIFAVASIDATKPPVEILQLMPIKLTLDAAIRADLDGDRSSEWVLVCTRTNGQPSQMQDNQVVVGVFKKSRSGWKSKGWKEAGSNFTSVRLIQADGGKTREVAVFCFYPGADFGVETVDVFGFDKRGFKHLGQGGGLNGGVEVADYDGDGLAEIKAWSELWRRELNHAEVFEHITDIQRVRSGKYVAYKTYRYDSKKKRAYPMSPAQAERMLKNRGEYAGGLSLSKLKPLSHGYFPPKLQGSFIGSCWE